MQIIATVAHKGGTGKSTITAGLAGHWAAEGRDVIVVDFDPQGGVSAALGVPERHTMPTIADVVLRNTHPGNACYEVADNLHVISGSLELAGAEVEVTKRHGWQDLLRQRLDTLSQMDDTDMVLVDTSPGLGVLPFMGLRSSDDAIIVCEQSFLAMRVLPHMIATAERAQAHVAGIVPSMVDHRTGHSRDMGELMAERYANELLPPIPLRTALRDAALAGQTIQQFAPRSEAVAAFAQLAGEIERASIWHTDDI